MLFLRGLNLFLKKNQEISKEFSPLLENQNSFFKNRIRQKRFRRLKKTGSDSNSEVMTISIR
ncbi:hypothetical protein A0128_05065 [Leptospira tipperaryensis]|uniref:Uncharacterized protein n=1 Tax=Leptospira tipperaryensis TaxID=2564040 RepID=A0A1D7UUQ6_9LEPT|nr:hypothetical protein A0128_05065 [Leptospira tipperaryensis]